MLYNHNQRMYQNKIVFSVNKKLIVKIVVK